MFIPDIFLWSSPFQTPSPWKPSKSCLFYFLRAFLVTPPDFLSLAHFPFSVMSCTISFFNSELLNAFQSHEILNWYSSLCQCTEIPQATSFFRHSCLILIQIYTLISAQNFVFQTAIAKSVLEGQFVKLGMIPPEHPLPTACRSTLQMMWANNGDTISKQYAGTSALKVSLLTMYSIIHM